MVVRMTVDGIVRSSGILKGNIDDYSETMKIKDNHYATVAQSETSISGFKHLLDSSIDFSAGILGGTANCIVAQPFDTVKVKLQTFPAHYKGTIHCFVRTFQSDGIARGLYAGMVPSMMALISETSVLFTFYGICQKSMMGIFRLKKENEMTAVHNGLAGGVASLFSSLVLCPTELLKCRLQARRNMLDSGRVTLNYNGTWQLCREIIRSEGFFGFYRGLLATIVRDVPGNGFLFAAYEFSRSYFAKGKDKNEIGYLKTAFCGSLGGIAYWLSIYPVDSVKSRQQVYLPEHVRFFPTLKAMLREDGFVSLYRGLTPTICRSGLACAVLFCTYESSKAFMKSLFDVEKCLK